MGLCKSCVEKYKQKYMQRGFNETSATHMATKLLRRVRRRQRYEILKGIRNSFQSWLFRWCFLTQWRATLLASFRSLSIIWVGRGFNPDYTQNCTGTCMVNYCDNYMGECVTYLDCRQLATNCPMGSCGCPAPLPNSSQILNSCTCNASGYKCTTCSSQLCRVVSYSCPCSGTCGYNCNTGYTWNGSQCVASVGRKSMLGDGSSMIVNNA